MKFDLYTEVALSIDVPEHALKAGDIATIVEHFPAGGNNIEDGYALEFFNALGDTILVTILPESSLAEFTDDEILNARHRLAEAA
jgi:hypothetical protein